MSDDEDLSAHDKRYVWQLELESEIAEKCGEATLDVTRCQSAVFEFIDKLNDSLGDALQVPDHFKGLSWLNLPKDLSLETDLKNVLTVCDFFTYCCINCLHMLPFLKQFEQDYHQKPVLLLGIHSAKFENEKANENVVDAIIRHNISHPVGNDPNLTLWTQMSIACWPTVAILSPTGRLLFVLIGEKSIELYLQFYVDICLEYFRDDVQLEKKTAIMSNVQAKPLASSTTTNLLNFPSKISVSPKENLIAISNTLNNSILVTNEDGLILHIIGSNDQHVSGFLDGTFGQARFCSPQGVCWLDEDALLVCDTENHAIRLIDIPKKTVETIAGNGTMGDDKVGGQVGRLQALNSPWDITFDRQHRRAYIAMAGSHQVWILVLAIDGDTINNTDYSYLSCFCFAGDGNEQKRNNRNPLKASFAQPSGICLGSPRLATIYVADSESSSVRSIDLVKGEVNTVVGGNPNPMDLFAFGDQDGSGYQAKLQHCIGVAAKLAVAEEEGDQIYVVDSYNHKIKCVEAKTKACRSLPLDWSRFAVDDVAKLNEPNGLCLWRRREDAHGWVLLVADTNHHRILSVQLDTNIVSVFPIRKQEKVSTPLVDPWECINIEQKLCVGRRDRIKLKLNIAEPFKLEPESRHRVIILSNSKDIVASPSELNVNNAEDLVFELTCCSPGPQNFDDGALTIRCQLTLCNKLLNSCLFRKLKIVQPVLLDNCDNNDEKIIEINV